MLDAGKVELFDVRPEPSAPGRPSPQAKKLDAAGQEHLLGLTKDAPIALHCHHGDAQPRAPPRQLLREGFTNVYNLEGGIEAWSSEVDPSVPRY